MKKNPQQRLKIKEATTDSVYNILSVIKNIYQKTNETLMNMFISPNSFIKELIRWSFYYKKGKEIFVFFSRKTYLCQVFC